MFQIMLPLLAVINKDIFYDRGVAENDISWLLLWFVSLSHINPNVFSYLNQQAPELNLLDKYSQS